ncbi:hypothetical protein FB45DRAFT_921361 [Roridomyces roridus]|uniref:F-box domain-containing protein n=1 Tax=Roridomyces roridus TaxID=1738132 RepID=A0AAD7BQB3_9AGAR|nr:hypothetical protein FB45DRAFT_921361 [Roridomyces roridus]
MFLTLPTDLLEEIGKELDHTDQGHLRAVCKELEDATQRIFFSQLVIKTGKHLLRNDHPHLELLKALAAGQTGWNVHARKIHFIPGPYVAPERKKRLAFLRFGSEKKRESGQREVETLLKSALATMTHVRAIFWKPNSRDVVSLREVIADFIGRLPVLDEFGLDFTCMNLDCDAFTPPSVHGVRRFELTAFQWREMSSTRHPITDLIQSQGHLTSLHLYGREAWTEIWVALREARIALTEITTNVISTDLFKYLLSYTGVRKLDLGFQDAGSQAENDCLAGELYDSALLHHADSLVELRCAARYEGRLSFGEHNVHVVAQLRRLNFLTVSVNAGDGVALPSPEDDVVEEPDNLVDTTVNLLLETAATSLPALHRLTICAADPEANRDVICCCCGGGGLSRWKAVNRLIRRAVHGFRGSVANPFEVQVGGEVYGLRLLEGRCVKEEGGTYESYLKTKVTYD